MNIYITGDIHGDINRINVIKEVCKANNTTTDDLLILLGDVGINYYQDLRDRIRKDLLSKIPITFLCVNGNHEIKPQHTDKYTEKRMFGNMVYYEPDYPNVLFLKDGERYTINGKSYLVLGGAYSVDKDYRIRRGWNWFKDEQLTPEEQEKILNYVKGREYDIILSHTCPDTWQPRELFLPMIDRSTVDNRTELWLEKIKNNISFQNWYFGHFHGDKSVPEEKYEMFYKKIKKLE